MAAVLEKEYGHLSVMLPEVLEAASVNDGDVVVDGTFGAGGYTRALLNQVDCMVYGIDRDPSAMARGAAMEKEYRGRFHFVRGAFGDLQELLSTRGIGEIDVLVLDIGVSSMQIDDPERGFSFREDGPLDMRMDDENEALPTAADIVNEYDEDDLVFIIKTYGEERHARRVARAIIEARNEVPFKTTGQLAALVRSVVHKSPKDPTDQATRTFQALRIAVNDELGELKRALVAAEAMLRPNGRLVVVSFHSLEDTIVKSFLRARAGLVPQGSRHLPQMPGADSLPSFRLTSKKAVFPSDEEISSNPRARSARMRFAYRTDAPPMSSKFEMNDGGRG